MRSRTRLRGRDRAVAAAGVRRLHRDARLLSSHRNFQLPRRVPWLGSTRRTAEIALGGSLTHHRLRKGLLAGGVLVVLSSAATLALASRRIAAEQAAFRAPAAARCVPAALNRSDVLPGTSLVVSPLPGSYDASPRTQISLLGAPAGALSSVHVRGSQTGKHTRSPCRLQPGRRRELRPLSPVPPRRDRARAREGERQAHARSRSPSTSSSPGPTTCPIHGPPLRRAKTPSRCSTSTHAPT